MLVLHVLVLWLSPVQYHVHHTCKALRAFLGYQVFIIIIIIIIVITMLIMIVCYYVYKRLQQFLTRLTGLRKGLVTVNVHFMYCSCFHALYLCACVCLHACVHEITSPCAHKRSHGTSSLISDYCATCNTSTCRMWQYIMKTNVKRLELFKYGLGAISSLQNHYYYIDCSVLAKPQAVLMFV